MSDNGQPAILKASGIPFRAEENEPEFSSVPIQGNDILVIHEQENKRLGKNYVAVMVRTIKESVPTWNGPVLVLPHGMAISSMPEELARQLCNNLRRLFFKKEYAALRHAVEKVDLTPATFPGGIDTAPVEELVKAVQALLAAE